MSGYIELSKELQDRIKEDRLMHAENPYAFKDADVVRRDMKHDRASLWRPAFVRDCEKIMHIPYFARYADKTQVFSLYKNDDISRRLLHVQLVSRIARNIGSMLNLNLDLIEAISLGHDIGHTPFGHAGEFKLNEIYHGHTGRYFNHNIQSARVLDVIFPVNISLQTLDGIICHNGELEMKEYRPISYDSFSTFDEKMMDCYTRREAVSSLVPSTLEACVMRVSDIIAYLGKDRQDALKLKLIPEDFQFEGSQIGSYNAQIIHNMTVNIIERSYGKPYLEMDPEYFEEFSAGKKQNYQYIYENAGRTAIFKEQIYPMFEQIYEKLLKDVKAQDESSVIYRHHIAYVLDHAKHYPDRVHYLEQDPNDIVADYIASMTDDYFIDLYAHMFKDGKYHVDYVGYFDND